MVSTEAARSPIPTTTPSTTATTTTTHTTTTTTTTTTTPPPTTTTISYDTTTYTNEVTTETPLDSGSNIGMAVGLGLGLPLLLLVLAILGYILYKRRQLVGATVQNIREAAAKRLKRPKSSDSQDIQSDQNSNKDEVEDGLSSRNTTLPSSNNTGPADDSQSNRYVTPPSQLPDFGIDHQAGDEHQYYGNVSFHGQNDTKPSGPYIDMTVKHPSNGTSQGPIMQATSLSRSPTTPPGEHYKSLLAHTPPSPGLYTNLISESQASQSPKSQPKLKKDLVPVLKPAVKPKPGKHKNSTTLLQGKSEPGEPIYQNVGEKSESLQPEYVNISVSREKLNRDELSRAVPIAPADKDEGGGQTRRSDEGNNNHYQNFPLSAVRSKEHDLYENV